MNGTEKNTQTSGSKIQGNELTNIVRPDGCHHEQGQRVQRGEVLDLKDHREKPPRDGDGEEDFEQSDEGQEPALGVDEEPEEDEGEAEDGQHGVLGDDVEDDVADDGGHEVVAVDLGVRAFLGLKVHGFQVIRLDESVRECVRGQKR